MPNDAMKNTIAIAIAVIILRWMREAEEAIDTASDRASARISTVTDGIATGVDDLRSRA